MKKYFNLSWKVIATVYSYLILFPIVVILFLLTLPVTLSLSGSYESIFIETGFDSFFDIKGVVEYLKEDF